ncbi:hypothetical protein DPMN_103510, partial [Dreissena polymorpha]
MVSEAVTNMENDDTNESANTFHDHEQLLEAKTDHPLDTCIQAISISPGQGNTP